MSVATSHQTSIWKNPNPTTAVLLLNEFVTLKPKDWIVLNAANSQVARCVIAIAKSRALNVVGIVRRPELVPQIEKLGVDFVGVESPELSKQIQIATGGMPISLGLDAIGGPATATIASVLSSGAHLVSYAWLSGLPIHVPPGDLIIKRLNIHGFWMYYDEYLPKIRSALSEATKVVACGVEVWRGGLGGAYRLPTLSFVGASLSPPCFRFHTPLIEPDVRVCRIPALGEDSRNRHSHCL